MSQLSLRKIPPDIKKAIEQETKQKGKSKTEVVIQALRAGFRLTKQTEKRKQLEQFFGKMTPAQYREFQKTTQDFEKIDPELWK